MKTKNAAGKAADKRKRIPRRLDNPKPDVAAARNRLRKAHEALKAAVYSGSPAKIEETLQEFLQSVRVCRDMAKQKSAECVDRVGPADAGMLDAYIAACRQQAGAVAALEKLTPAVLKILQEMQVVTRDGAKLKLDMSYGYEYSHAVQIAGRALIEMKEYERNAGTATVSNVYRVEFQDAAAP